MQENSCLATLLQIVLLRYPDTQRNKPVYLTSANGLGGSLPAGPTLMSLVGPGAKGKEGSARPIFPRGVGGNTIWAKIQVAAFLPCGSPRKKCAVVGRLGYHRPEWWLIVTGPSETFCKTALF